MTLAGRAAVKSIILASKSIGRSQLLHDAGIDFSAVTADIDEAAIEEKLLLGGAKASAVAAELAQAKALKIAADYPDSLTLGSDQILVGPDGNILRKVASPDEAKRQLASLAGREHQLISAAVIVEGDTPVWRAVESATLMMHGLTAQYISDYVARHWDDIRHCVGCYRIEAEGRSLFDWIEGDESVIVGMPMPPLLDYLSRSGYERAI